MIKKKKTHVLSGALMSFAGIIILISCVSHLREAKSHYAEAQRLGRAYQTKAAFMAFSLTRQEAELEIKKRPSAQAFMLKGLAELSLEKWEDAEDSFRQAFAYGFEKGEEWAEHISLLGMALSLQELGLEDSSARVYDYLIQRAKIRPVVLLAAQRFTDLSLKNAAVESKGDRQKALDKLLKRVEMLSEKDLSCGYYHYLQSQILSHLSDYTGCFEEAVWARELGLPSGTLMRDNDNQIVFCYQALQQRLPSDDWERFQSVYMGWVKKWGWRGPETPDWKGR
jgi:tetratricopeptide (TPR) repeat protein